MNESVLSGKAVLLMLALGVAIIGCSSAGSDKPDASAAANLSALSVSDGILAPAFDPSVTKYDVEVETSVKSITVSGAPAEKNATISESGTAARSLPIGETAIVLTVTAPDGSAKAYTVTVFRKPVAYAVGWFASGASYLPCYWKGTTRSALDVPAGTTNADATGACVVSGSFYVSGYHKSGTTYDPCFWKDGVRTDLATGGVGGRAFAIAISGGSVYVAGEYYPASHGGDSAPCYWKDGVLYALDHPGDKYAAAKAIAVLNGEVYTAGSYTLDGYDLYACYWKGSAKTDLSVPAGKNRSEANSIALSGGSIHVAGSYSTNYIEADSKGAYWKDGARTDVVATGASKTWVSSLSLDGGTAYLAGFGETGDGSKIACVWKGSEEIALSAQDRTYTNAIALLGGRAYCAGQVSNGLTGADMKYVACVWEAGVRRNLETSVSSDTEAIALGE